MVVFLANTVKYLATTVVLGEITVVFGDNTVVFVGKYSVNLQKILWYLGQTPRYLRQIQ